MKSILETTFGPAFYRQKGSGKYDNPGKRSLSLPLNIEQIYAYLHDFDFADLFVKELHWSLPVSRRRAPIDDKHSRLEITRFRGMPVFEISADDGNIPNLKVRDALHKEISSLFRKSVLIFIDESRSQSIWHWVKRERDTAYRREYFYTKGQPEDLLLNKLSSIVTDITAPDEKREGKGGSKLSKEAVLRKIYQEFDAQHRRFSQYIDAIDMERDRDLYASILLNRLIFIYFLQRRGFIDDGNTTYLEDALRRSSKGCYYREFLLPLFFEGLAKPVEARNKDINALLGRIVYLDGGIFLPHAIELQYSNIQIPDIAFEKLFSFFSNFTWQIVDIPSGEDEEITPDILGHIFEMHFNQISAIGPYYTPPEITEYLCRQTIHQVILERVNQQASQTQRDRFITIEEMLAKLDAELCSKLLLEVLPSLSVLDPACGSGTFLVAAMNTLVTIYSEILSKIGCLNDASLSIWLRNLCLSHPSLVYFLKKSIITNNLYGVDIREDAVEITRLRLFLGLIASSQNIKELEPLPRIDFHLSVGNSLVGLLRVSANEDINPLDTGGSSHAEVIAQLNRTLLIKLNQNDRRYQRNELNIEDIEKLVPFHWGYEFLQIMNERGGFDVIITNPPWEVPKPENTKAAEPNQRLVLQLSPQYEHQNPAANYGIQGADINLYKLFVEQSYNLLRKGGYCGIVVPNGIYTDLSTKRLRELLFKSTRVTGLFCFENRKKIFAELHRSVKLVLLTFEKGKKTEMIPAALAKQDIEELDRFPSEGSIRLSTEFIRRSSPGSLSIAEFRNQLDIRISEKMLRFPSLGEKIQGVWNIKLATGGFRDAISRLSQAEAAPDTLPLYEGNMIHQFANSFVTPQFWISKHTLLSRQVDKQQKSGYRGYRLGFRDIASNSNERTLIATVLPPNVLAGNTINYTSSPIDADVLLFLTAVFNSFVADFSVRLRISTRVTISTVYQLPVPRLTREDASFSLIVKRVARLICTTHEFKELWEKAISDPWYPEVSATNSVERNQLCAELDALIAHLYNVTEEEFTYILRTFPLVADPIKIATQNAYRDVERGLIS